jgi:S-DNA-T family DNA segregation ATPase FtsK/SpoIIIE
MAKRGRPPKGSDITIKSRETQVFLGFIFIAVGISLFVNNSLSGAIPQMILTNFGQTTYILGAFAICFGLKLVGIKIFLTSERFLYGLLLLLAIMLPLLSFWIPEESQVLSARQGEGGGVIGLFLHNQLYGFMGRPAELGVLIAFLLLAISILSGISITQFGEILNGVFTFFYRNMLGAGSYVKENMPKPEIVNHEKLGKTEKPEIKGIKNGAEEDLDVENTLHPKIKEMDVEEMDLPEIGVDDFQKKVLNAAAPEPKIKMSFGPDLQGHKDENDDEEDDGSSDLERQFREKYAPKFPTWAFAPMDLLEKSSPDPFKEQDVYDRSKQIEQTLATFKIQARVAKIFIGPSIVQYALNLAPGTKVSKLAALSKDIGLALAANSESIRIASIAGTSLVGIEVPRKESHIVRIREVLESKEMSRDVKRIPLAIGKDIRGDIVVEDLQSMPHLLIAGATGTGKSVTMNDVLMGLIMKFTPDELRLILVDPKMVEMSLYNGLPYLLTPVITDMDKVVGALDWTIDEMTQRYKLFKEKGVRNLDEFNESSTFRLPYIVLAIDEMADLILTKKAEVETKIVRLAQLARATGIHLILATQRPTVQVITGLIKANVPARIALGVTNGVDSRVIIDNLGAEALIGKGDMLVKSPDAGKLRRVQGALLTTKEIQRVADFIKQKSKAMYPEENWYFESLDQATNEAAVAGSTVAADAMDDPLFRQAVQLCIQQGKASASTIQRFMKIGFNRAARMVDQMEQMGIVAPSSGGGKAREVLVSSMDEVMARMEGSGETDPF